jgi:hypothetical protein
MANRSDRGQGQTFVTSRASRARKPEWDLVRGNHQGQRFMPRKQAGHKTAPDQRAKPSQIPRNAGAIHTGRSFRKRAPAADTLRLAGKLLRRRIFVTHRGLTSPHDQPASFRFSGETIYAPRLGGAPFPFLGLPLATSAPRAQDRYPAGNITMIVPCPPRRAGRKSPELPHEVSPKQHHDGRCSDEQNGL